MSPECLRLGADRLFTIASRPEEAAVADELRQVGIMLREQAILLEGARRHGKEANGE